METEVALSTKGYSASDERRILDALGRGLLKEFPNPGRVGCPGSEVLERIASHEMPLSDAEKWLNHLGSCSPCYADFKRLQDAHDWRRRRVLVAVAAGILLAIAATGWALVHKYNEDLMTQTAVLDLRGRSPARGTEANPEEPPLEISHRVTHMKIYLPLGSAVGNYDVRILGPLDKTLFSTKGKASQQQGITSLSIDMNLASANPDLYVLELEKAGAGEWASYPLRVK